MRFQPRRVLLWVILCGGVCFIAVSILHRTIQKYEINTVYPSGTTKLPYESPINDLDISTFPSDIVTTSQTIPEEKKKLWYFKGGSIFPEKHQGPLQLFPDESSGDRIENQLMYVPEDYEDTSAKQKLILVYQGIQAFYLNSFSLPFHGCPINKCLLTNNRAQANIADAIVFKDSVHALATKRPDFQIWLYYQLECPYHTGSVSASLKKSVNWTSSYRRDSTIVAPYERWTYYDEKVKTKKQSVNYAAHKTKQVAWFVSNCGGTNHRLNYAKELSKYITVDIYGSCGTLHCPKSDNDKCFDMVQQEYKFYLAFENSNCRDYITEKFFVNGLGHAMLPIAMGARPEDYKQSAPEHSYIHVEDFDSPKDLAAYLHKLDKDDDLYNAYFEWKGTGEFINTFYWCRLCAMLHSPSKTHYYEDVNDWWRRPGTCTPGSWKTST